MIEPKTCKKVRGAAPFLSIQTTLLSSLLPAHQFISVNDSGDENGGRLTEILLVIRSRRRSRLPTFRFLHEVCRAYSFQASPGCPAVGAPLCCAGSLATAAKLNIAPTLPSTCHVYNNSDQP